MNDVTSDRWLSVVEIAGYLSVKRGTIYKWIGSKSMPAHMVANRGVRAGELSHGRLCGLLAVEGALRARRT